MVLLKIMKYSNDIIQVLNIAKVTLKHSNRCIHLVSNSHTAFLDLGLLN